jgi:hypothetical protein
MVMAAQVVLRSFEAAGHAWHQNLVCSSSSVGCCQRPSTGQKINVLLLRSPFLLTDVVLLESPSRISLGNSTHRPDNDMAWMRY